MYDHIVREKLKKYEQIYVPREAHQDGSVFSATIQLERDGKRNHYKATVISSGNIHGKAVKANIEWLQGPGTQVRQMYKHKCTTNLRTDRGSSSH